MSGGQLSKPRPRRSRVRSQTLRLPVLSSRSSDQRVAWMPDEAERLGRERERLRAHELGLRGERALPVEQVEHHRRAEPRATRRRARCSRARRRRGRCIALPQNTQKRLQVSITPPHTWVNLTSSSCGNVSKKWLAELGPRLRAVLELGRHLAADSSRRRRSHPTGSGCPTSGGSSGTGWGCRDSPCRFRQPIDASCSVVKRLGDEAVVVDRRDVVPQPAQQRREGVRGERDLARPDRAERCRDEHPDAVALE